MAVIHTFGQSTETWDEKLLRLNSLTISTETYNHWGVEPNIGISGYLTSVLADRKQILSNNGCEERVDSDGTISWVWVSEESKMSTTTALDAYDNARLANVYVTGDSGNVFVRGMLFEVYVENFMSNTRVSLTP